MKVAVVIVTCNRRQMLRELLEDFMSQSRKPEAILVIDNGSQDGTAKLVRENYPYVQLFELNENSGLFGGLEIGTMAAIRQEYDAVWLIDDDARLKKDALERLLHDVKTHDGLRESVIWCTNISPDDEFFTEPVCVKVEDEWKVYHKLLPELVDKVYETNGGPNIGIYISRSVIEDVGPPQGDMIFCGEHEFIYRVQQGGYKLFRCFSSILYHKRHKFTEIKLWGRTRYVSQSPPWHTYYEIRNRIYVDLTYKRRTVLRSLLNTAIDSAIKVYICDEKISTLVYILRGIYDGLFGKMGMRVHIPRLLPDKQK